jgi:hypothetical protein
VRQWSGMASWIVSSDEVAVTGHGVAHSSADAQPPCRTDMDT